MRKYVFLTVKDLYIYFLVVWNTSWSWSPQSNWRDSQVTWYKFSSFSGKQSQYVFTLFYFSKPSWNGWLQLLWFLDVSFCFVFSGIFLTRTPWQYTVRYLECTNFRAEAQKWCAVRECANITFFLFFERNWHFKFFHFNLYA